MVKSQATARQRGSVSERYRSFLSTSQLYRLRACPLRPRTSRSVRFGEGVLGMAEAVSCGVVLSSPATAAMLARDWPGTDIVSL
jgi:hypothetical protein